MIYDKSQIISLLDEKITAFNRYIESLNAATFEATPNGKWSAGQNLDHLIRSIKPLQIAFNLPKLFLVILFGKTNRPSRTYDQLVSKYKIKLAAGGSAAGPFIPKTILFNQRSDLLKKYERQKVKLMSKINNHSEKDLDLYILPHPLLGKLTLREMLYFTIHHNEHHLGLLKSRN